MKRLVLFATLAALAFSSASAQDTNFAVQIDCDFQEAEKGIRDLTLLQGSAPMLQVRPMIGTSRIASDALTTVQFILAPTATGTYFVATNSYLSTNGAYWIQLGTIGTNSCPTNSTTPAPWFYTVLFSRNGGVYWSGNGKAYIEAATFTGTNGLVWQEWAAGAAKDDLAREWIADLSNVVENIEVGDVVYGTTNGSAFRGDWGNAVSNKVRIMETGKLDSAVAASTYQQAGSYATGTPLYVETYQGTITGATISTGAAPAIVTNAGVLGITVPAGGITAADAGQIGTNILSNYTNTLPLPGCAILPVDPATSNAWIGASGLYGFYTITNNATPWNLCISNTQYRSPYGYGIKVVSTQAMTAGTNFVRVGAAPAALTATNLIAVWPHEDPAKWNYKIQPQ